MLPEMLENLPDADVEIVNTELKRANVEKYFIFLQSLQIQQKFWIGIQFFDLFAYVKFEDFLSVKWIVKKSLKSKCKVIKIS